MTVTSSPKSRAPSRATIDSSRHIARHRDRRPDLTCGRSRMRARISDSLTVEASPTCTSTVQRWPQQPRIPSSHWGALVQSATTGALVFGTLRTSPMSGQRRAEPFSRCVPSIACGCRHESSSSRGGPPRTAGGSTPPSNSWRSPNGSLSRSRVAAAGAAWHVCGPWSGRTP